MHKELKLFLLIALVTLFYMDKGGGDMSYRYLDMTHAIVDEGRLAIDTFHTNTDDKAFYDGHYYSLAAPGLSLLSIPPYLVFKALYVFMPARLEESINSKVRENYIGNGRFAADDPFLKINLAQFMLSSFFIMIFTGPILAGLFGILMYRLIGRVTGDEKIRTFLALVSVLGTPVFFYSTVHHAHVATAFFAVLAFYLLYTDSPNHILAGLSTGLILFFNFALPFVALGLGIYALQKLKIKELIFFGGAAAMPVLLLLFFNFLMFSDPLSFPHQHSFGSVMTSYHEGGFAGITFPSMAALWGLSFSQFRGVFFYTPLLLIGLIGLFRLKRPEATSISVIFFGTLLFFAAFKGWNGAWSFGPRFLIPALSLLFYPAAVHADKIDRRVLYGLCAVSIFINWIGVLYPMVSDSYKNPIFEVYLPKLFTEGPSSHISKYLSVLAGVPGWILLIVNIAAACMMALGIYFLVRDARENVTSSTSKRHGR
ncbi:MAG: hypothetical protein HGA85_03815 [Nanoarchaeota archaeon]|nr:hypothetical protein [Nanoarchaeota archaeon]